MRLLVVYTSKTGFTKRYAQWLAEDLSGDCFPLEQAARVDFSGYDAVVFGSSVHAGGVRKLAWLKKRLPALAGKWMMGVFRKMLASQKNPSPEDKLAAQMVGSSYDKTDRASLKPLEDYLTH